MDHELGHAYSTNHKFKHNYLKSIQATKRSRAAYHIQGFTFVPLATNTLGQMPHFLRFLWSLADHSAHNTSEQAPQTDLLLLENSTSDQSCAAFKSL